MRVSDDGERDLVSSSVVDDLEELWYRRGVEHGRAEERAVRTVRVWAESDEARVLPVAFVDAYRELCEAALRGLGSSVGPGDGALYSRPRVNRARTSTGQTETRGLAKPEKKRGAGKGVGIRSEKWLAVKGRVDRKLRKIGRDVSLSLEGLEVRGTARRCVKCKQFGEPEWVWCPWDRAAMEEVE